jgi:dihydroorotase
VAYTAAVRAAIVMPNLTPPITTTWRSHTGGGGAVKRRFMHS